MDSRSIAMVSSRFTGSRPGNKCNHARMAPLQQGSTVSAKLNLACAFKMVKFSLWIDSIMLS